MNIFWGGTANAGPEKLQKLKFLHRGDCNSAEIVLLVHFISMQLNFPVLWMFSCVAPETAGFMHNRMQV